MTYSVPQHSISVGSQRTGLAAAVHEGEVFLFGGHNGETPLKTAESWHPSHDPNDSGQWQALPPLLARRSYLSASILDGKVYAIGGSADGRTLNTFDVFDLSKRDWDHWFTKPPMQTKRTQHAAAVADGRIYVTGGFDGIRDLRSVEVFDPRTNTWSSSIDSMDGGRSYHALVTFAGSVYAIGGQDRTSKSSTRSLVSVEAFDLWSERWYQKPSLSVGRIGLSAVVMEDGTGTEFIYVTGGSDADVVHRSCERFNLQQGVWEEIPPMVIPRLGHASVVVDGMLYVIGGYDGKVVLDTFECFDPYKNSWSPPLQIGARQESLAAISY